MNGWGVVTRSLIVEAPMLFMRWMRRFSTKTIRMSEGIVCVLLDEWVSLFMERDTCVSKLFRDCQDFDPQTIRSTTLSLNLGLY